MAARLPKPGGDTGNWGSILNEYLSQTLKDDGTLKDNVVTGAALSPDAVNSSALASNAVTESSLNTGTGSDGQVLVKDSTASGGMKWAPPGSSSVPPATTTSLGTVQLSGDLGGTAAAPTVPKLAQKANVSDVYTKSETDSALAGKANSSALDGKANTNHTHSVAQVEGLQSALDGRAPSNHSHSLDALSDVSASGASNGQSLVFNNGSWAPAAVSAGSAAIDDASTSTKGVVRLAGDLGGTADNPTVPGLAAKANTSDIYTRTQADGLLGAKADTSALAAKADTSALANYVPLTQKGANNGVASLDASGKVPAAQLPATTSPVTSVAGKTGAVTLTAADVGLANVSNTSDANKPISTATQAALDGKAASSHTHTLDALSDVSTSGASAGQALVYNNGTWQPGTIPTGGGGGESPTDATIAPIITQPLTSAAVTELIGGVIRPTKAEAEAAAAAGAPIALYLVDASGGSTDTGSLAITSFSFPELIVGQAITPIQLAATGGTVDQWLVDGLPGGLTVSSTGQITGTPVAPQTGVTTITARAGTVYSNPLKVNFEVTGTAGAILLDQDWRTATTNPYVPQSYNIGGTSYTPTLSAPSGGSLLSLATSSTAVTVTGRKDGATTDTTGTYDPGLYLPLEPGNFTDGAYLSFPGLPGTRTVRLQKAWRWISAAGPSLVLWDGGAGFQARLNLGEVGFVRANITAPGAVQGERFNLSSPDTLRARMTYNPDTNESQFILSSETNPGRVSISTWQGDARAWTGLTIGWPNASWVFGCIGFLQVLGGDVA